MADRVIEEFDVAGVHVHLVDGYPGLISYADVTLSATHPGGIAKDDRGALMTHEDAVRHELYKRHGGDWRLGPPKHKDGRTTHEIWQA